MVSAAHLVSLGVDMAIITIKKKTPAEQADEARSAAAKRIAEIRMELIDHLVDGLVGAAAEKAKATSALALIRGELEKEKAKL